MTNDKQTFIAKLQGKIFGGIIKNFNSMELSGLVEEKFIDSEGKRIISYCVWKVPSGIIVYRDDSLLITNKMYYTIEKENNDR